MNAAKVDSLNNPEEDKYFFFFTHTPVAAVVSDSSYNIIEWNLEAERVFGYTREEAVGNNLIYLLYSEANKVSPHTLKENLLNTLIHKKRSKNINYDRTKDGRDILCEWLDLPYSSKEGQYIFSTVRDVTEEKQFIDSLTSEVEQKELKMREIQHRFKNNIAIITSLINLRKTNEHSDEALEDLQSKIHSLSSLYEKLYEHNNTSRVDLGEYIEELLYSVFTSLSNFPFTIQVEMGKMYMEPENAVILGLIANEAATNAIKHGFDINEECVFCATLKRADSGDSYIFSLSNTGHPFPENFSIHEAQSFGLQLIANLTQQLEGSIEILPSPPAELRITIPSELFLSHR